MNLTPVLSIVIPAYNEAGRLPRYLETVRAYCESTLPSCYEVIVVDDGSQDGTWAWLQEARATWVELHLIRHDRNQGKGAAVRTGLRAATGQYILFSDADGATPIVEEAALRCSLAAGRDMAIGIRSSRDDRVKRQVFRAIQALVFRTLVKALFGLHIRDTQCGFKMLTRASANSLVPVLTETGYLLDIEMLLAARDRHLAVSQHRVGWTEQSGSKVRPVRDGLRMLLGLWRLHKESRRNLVMIQQPAELRTVATLPTHDQQ
jgi:dolichyl-phosphate beta-glucosyltransferase